MFFPRRSNLRNFLHYSAWPTGPERNNPKQNGAGLSRSGVRAGIFPQKFKRKGVAPVVFRHRLIPHRRNFVRAILKSTGHSGNQCCCWNSRANCSNSERRRRRWKCCSIPLEIFFRNFLKNLSDDFLNICGPYLISNIFPLPSYHFRTNMPRNKPILTAFCVSLKHTRHFHVGKIDFSSLLCNQYRNCHPFCLSKHKCTT